MHSILQEGAFPLVLSGDHSIAVGTVAGVADDLRTRGESLGLLWIDAHADLNTVETSPSGNVHGMPLAAILGHGHPRLLEVGGAGYFRASAVRGHLEAGRLRRVADAPVFLHPAYAVYSENADTKIVTPALTGLRHVAAGEATREKRSREARGRLAASTPRRKKRSRNDRT